VLTQGKLTASALLWLNHWDTKRIAEKVGVDECVIWANMDNIKAWAKDVASKTGGVPKR
jgi:hypothetical protein